MEATVLNNILKLRYLVGYLGEKSQFYWWESDFVNPTKKKMLEFVFPRTANIAQYEAVKAAAAKIHDKSIGIGKSFHLFRLPEYVEKTLLEALKAFNGDEFESLVYSREKALDELTELANSASLAGEGPINIGQVKNSQWEQSISIVASDISSQSIM